MSFEPSADFDAEFQPQIEDINLSCEERPSDSPYVERIWQSLGETSGSFISTAISHSEIVVTRFHDSTILTVRGPETKASIAHTPDHASATMGIILKVGAFMPKFPASMLIDRQDLNLPQAGSKSFWLDSSAWEFPTYENADTFIERLVREDLLVFDALVDEVLQEYPTDLSRRTVQRRFLQATGLTHNKVFQIQRTRYATNLLKQGVSILDTVEQAGYADQPHLTRALRQFMGQTPAQIANGNTDKPMSLLFKTSPF